MSRSAELEAAILVDPDDPEPYLVYADWLSEQGDPRGRLIQLEVHGRGTAGAAAAKAWIDAHAQHFYGRVAPEVRRRNVRVEWSFGFWHTVTVRVERDRDLLERLEVLFACESAAVVRQLVLATPGYSGPKLERLLGYLPAHAPPSLRGLDLGEVERGHWPPVKLETLAGLPRLDRLVLPSGAFVLHASLAARLVELELDLDNGQPESVAELLRWHWPRLARLVLRPIRGGRLHADAVRELLATRAFPALRYLGLVGAGFSRGLVPSLARSPLLPGLDSLDVSHGHLGPEDAAELLERFDAFRHLRELDLRHHVFGADGRAILHGLEPPLRLGHGEDARAYGYLDFPDD